MLKIVLIVCGVVGCSFLAFLGRACCAVAGHADRMEEDAQRKLRQDIERKENS